MTADALLVLGVEAAGQVGIRPIVSRNPALACALGSTVFGITFWALPVEWKTSVLSLAVNASVSHMAGRVIKSKMKEEDS